MSYVIAVPLALMLVSINTPASTAQQFLAPPPFDSCNPSSPQILTLAIQEKSANAENVTIGIALKNTSEKTFTVQRRDPERVLAARVLDSAGKPVALTPAGKDLYSPAKPNTVLAESGVGPVQLKPQESLDFGWRISDIFELSKPGTYTVAIKAVITMGLLTATACSNKITLDVRP